MLKLINQSKKYFLHLVFLFFLVYAMLLKLLWLLLLILFFYIAYLVYAFYLNRREKLARWKFLYVLTVVFFLAIGLRVFVFEVVHVTSNSMEPTLQEGDLIYLSKLAYGPRAPVSVFEVPWLNMAAEMFNSKKSKYRPYLPHKRFSGKGEIDRGDVIVFLNPGRSGRMMIKRCVGIPGDSIEQKEDVYRINAGPSFTAVYMRRRYHFKKKDLMKVRQLFDDHQLELQLKKTDELKYCATYLSREEFEKIKDKGLLWPPENTYARDTTYVLKENNFFVLGDNRPNSIDSRVWGPIDRNLIIGKAEAVLFSKEQPGFDWQQIGLKYSYK